MKKKNLIFNTISVFLGIFVLLFVVINNSKGSWLTRGDSEPYSITFNNNTNKIGTEDFAFNTYHNGKGFAKTGLNNPIEFDYVGFANPPTLWQTIAPGGYFTNTDSISGMMSFSFEKNNSAANIGVYWSNSLTFNESPNVIFDSTSPLIVSTSFDDSFPNYIKVVALGSGNSGIKNAKIEFNCSDHYSTLSVVTPDSSMGNVYGSGGYTAGSDVTITATAKKGYKFVGWYRNGLLLSELSTYNFVMPYGDAIIEGRFTYASYNLNVASEDEGKGLVYGTGEFSYTEQVTIIATPIQGYKFVGWYQGSNLISALPSYTFNMPYNHLNYVAKFDLDSFAINLSTEDNIKGSVSGGGIFYYTQGVTLSAAPETGYTFIGWFSGENLISSNNPYSFTMPANDLTYIAKFSANEYELELESNDTEKGTVSGGGTFAYNSEVTIIASPSEGNAFIGWYLGNTLVSNDEAYTFPMPYNSLSYIAKFMPEYTVDVTNFAPNKGIVLGVGKYGHTANVTLTAMSLEGYYFDAWYDTDYNLFSRGKSLTFIMPNYNVFYFANFIDIDPYPIEKGVEFDLGTYPQTKVTDSSLISTLNDNAGTLPTSANSQSWTSYNYYISSSNTTKFMWYQDVSVDDELYRGVYFTSYRPFHTTYSSSTSNSYQDDNGYLINNRYWFKFEPISWDVLSVNEEAGPLVLSSKIIDSQEYYHSGSDRNIGEETIYPNNYRESNIRTWLNDSFLNTAFSPTEQNLIKTTNVDNSVYSTGSDHNQYATANTDDKLFLPSYSEVVNADYGFTNSASRVRSATDYAKAMGAYVYSGNSPWWLRSPSNDSSDRARRVDYDGHISRDIVDRTGYGLRPAFRINR